MTALAGYRKNRMMIYGAESRVGTYIVEFRTIAGR
jgi:hypothetical protein